MKMKEAMAKRGMQPHIFEREEAAETFSRWCAAKARKSRRKASLSQRKNGRPHAGLASRRLFVVRAQLADATSGQLSPRAEQV